ncbi:4,5:9,10-diseco-3-hydroxy-5,9,17-trioxoandrosta-1(10),2-diene-4-oate hydrolase [compost metagenome]
MPGFGKSDEMNEAWSIDDYTDFIIKFIEYFKISKLSILGHSFGGRIIIKLANREDLSFEIDKLILVDAAGIKHYSKNISIKTRIYKSLKVIVSNKMIKKLFPNALESLKQKFGSEDYKNASRIMRETMVKAINEDLTDLLPTIRQSTLLIWGENDTATPIQDAILMQEKIPDAGLVTIKGAGHFSFIENPYLVNNVLDSFIGGKN